MTLVVLPQADQDLRAAQEWYDVRRSGLGNEMFHEFLRAVGQIEQTPDSWRRIGGGYRRVNLVRFPYGIIYRLDGPDIVITAFAHHRRHPGYWRVD